MSCLIFPDPQLEDSCLICCLLNVYSLALTVKSLTHLERRDHFFPDVDNQKSLHHFFLKKFILALLTYTASSVIYINLTYLWWSISELFQLFVCSVPVVYPIYMLYKWQRTWHLENTRNFIKKSEKMGQDTCIDTCLTEKEIQMANKNLKIIFFNKYFQIFCPYTWMVVCVGTDFSVANSFPSEF